MEYRREIDGLRTIAVLPVILFHAGISAFSGGYVGVDVFFVISGYLITSIILAEKQAGTFTLAGFYERRARRILPALFVVMLVCLPFAWLWILPSDLKDFSRSLIGVSVFASNILFWRESGYFVTAAELKPLLHTWSLAVEEQYYLLFPLFIVLAWPLGKKWIAGLLTLVLAISLAGAQWGAINKPIANFYLLPPRGWELMIGALVAFYTLSTKDSNNAITRKPALAEAGSLCGLLLISFSIFAYDKTTPFPSLYTLVPTLGAALIILFAHEKTLTGRLLGSRIFVFLGLLSYSTYLWHQPLFAFARQRAVDDPPKALLLALGVLAIFLAFISLHVIERPFRNKQRFSRRTIAGLALGSSLSFIAIGYWGYASEGIPDRFPPTLSQYIYPEKTNEGIVCLPTAVAGYGKLKMCEFGDKNALRSIALYGDSHSQALFSVLDKEFKRRSMRGVRVYLDDCGVIPGVLLDNKQQRTGLPKKECLAAYESMLTYFKKNVESVVVGVRWTMQVYPVAGSIDSLAYNNGEGGVEFIEPRKYITMDDGGVVSYEGAGKAAAIEYLLQSMNKLNMKVFVVGPVPEVGWEVPKYNFGTYLDKGEFPKVISTSYERFKERNRFVNDSLDKARGYTNIVYIKPENLLCDTYVKGRCVAQFDGLPLYFDDDHLSNAGAELVVNEIARNLK